MIRTHLFGPLRLSLLAAIGAASTMACGSSVENDDVEVTTTGDRLMIEAKREFEEEDAKHTLPKIRVAERSTVNVA